MMKKLKKTDKKLLNIWNNHSHYYNVINNKIDTDIMVKELGNIYKFQNNYGNAGFQKYKSQQLSKYTLPRK
jgi:flagellar biosynthesis chaperone FliJ